MQEQSPFDGERGERDTAFRGRTAMLPYKTILHPTDFSERSERARRIACALARDCGARLITLHVVSESSTLATEPAGPGSSAEVTRHTSAEESLDKLLADSTVKMEAVVDVGDPATAILRVATEIGADLIVMGAHGQTGLRHLLVGSVAEKIIREAACPVLTLRSTNR